MLFKILLYPFFSEVYDSKTLLFEHHLSQPSSALDIEAVLSQLATTSLKPKDEELPKNLHLPLLSTLSSSTIVSPTLLRKRTQADKLEEELKHEMNPLRLHNKLRDF